VSIIYIFFCFLILNGCEQSKENVVPSEIKFISLAPHITEVIYALNAQNQLIAVTDFCRYPEDAFSKEKIGGFLNPNIEKMLTLNPTFLFGLPSHEKLSQQLKKFGLTVIMMPNENTTDVLQTINSIGKIIDRREQANHLVQQIKNTLDTLKLNSTGKSIQAVLMVGREKGSLRNITVAGKNTYIDELWERVGGKNSYADLATRYGMINLESLLLRDPDVIIEFDMKKARGIYREDITPEWRYMENLKAVKNKNIFVIGGSHTMIPGPRIILLAEDFNEIVKAVVAKRELP
jgi:iron complex transport system substrate-binding protein